MTAHRPAYELEHLLTDAALQSWYMNARRIDLADEANNVKIIYGVDANVVRAWGNPHDNATRPYRIGRVFRSDEDALATAIGWGLLSFIFSKLGPGRIPFMIIPPIEVELLNILDALNNSAQTNEQSGASEAVRDELQAVTTQLSGKLTSSALADINLKLKDLLLEELGPSRALNRINLLFTRSEIAPMDELRSRFPSELREILLPSTGLLVQWYEISKALSGTKEGGGFTEGWTDRLSRAGNWWPSVLMDHDAQVLAKIEVWNRTLFEKKLPWKVLYLTADYRLFRAASQYCAPWQNQHSFAEAYLRHPHAYLSEEGVLGPVEDGDGPNDPAGAFESVGDWLALLTQPANAKPEELLEAKLLNSSVPRAIHDFALSLAKNGNDRGATTDDIAKEINDKWREFAKGALVTDPFSGNSLDGLTKDLRRPAKELVRIVEDRHAGLERDRRKHLRDYILVTTRLGRKFEAAKTIKPVIRPVSPVFFEDWPAASKAIAIMSRWSDVDVDSPEYQQAVDLLEREDTTGYAFYLGHAAFFAARGRWKSAALLARRARRIGQTFRSEMGFADNARGAHGREAAYFEATCLKQLARRSESLVAARACLDEASQILKLEKAIGTYSEFVEERIPLEHAIIDLHDYLFKSFVEEAEGDHTDRFRAAADKLWPIARALGAALSATDTCEYQIGDVVETRIRLERQLLVLIVSLSFLPDCGDIDLERARDAIIRLESLIPDAHATDTGLSEFERVVLMAGSIRAQPSRVKSAIRRRFEESINTIERSGDLRPYDVPLLNSLRKKTLRY
jgi:hypothetical protein